MLFSIFSSLPVAQSQVYGILGAMLIDQVLPELHSWLTDGYQDREQQSHFKNGKLIGGVVIGEGQVTCLKLQPHPLEPRVRGQGFSRCECDVGFFKSSGC